MSDKIILGVSCSDEWADTDCDYAVVELTDSLRQTILERIQLLTDLKKKQPDLYEMYYWSYHAQFFSQFDELDERLAEEGDCGSDTYLKVPDDYVIPEEQFQSTECDQMIIREDSVQWVAIPKHSSLYVTTREIPIDKIAREEQCATKINRRRHRYSTRHLKSGD